jgi:hypothetical protein
MSQGTQYLFLLVSNYVITGTWYLHPRVPNDHVMLSRIGSLSVPSKATTGEKKKKKPIKSTFHLALINFSIPSLLPISVGMDSTHVEINVQSQDEMDLTDDQIQQLLLEAEGRLRGSGAQLAPDSDVASLR